jgi:hypothetical protein
MVVMADVKGPFDTAAWNKGKVSLFQALGISGATYPEFKPQLVGPAAVNSPGPMGTGTTQDVPPSSGAGAGHPPGGAGGRYSYGQLQDLWVSAGGKPASKKIAAAIALAESGGVVKATNHNSNGSTDRGLWQINSIHGSQSTFDPMANARAAVAISSNGSNWNPWVTYKTGAYRKFLK